MHSLKSRLLGLWCLSLLASLAVGALLFQLYHQSAQAQLARAQAVTARACDLIQDRYSFYVTGWTGPAPPLDEPGLRRSLTAAVVLALLHQTGVAGGIWQSQAGSLAYAFPSGHVTGANPSPPEAERPEIAQLNQEAERDTEPASSQIDRSGETVLLHACPLRGPIVGLTAWTMTRVTATAALGPLQLGLGVLLSLLVVMAAWLGRTLLVWGRHVQAIAQALAAAGPDAMAAVPRTGEQELDRIIAALNQAGERLDAARQQTEAMSRRAARAERLAALGRVAAGVAHEIRNPLAAARLQGENGLAGDDTRRRQAISDMLAQIDRLEGLAGELLAMTQRAEPHPVPVDLAAFLQRVAAQHQHTAEARRVTLTVTLADADRGAVRLDPSMVTRILDNLLSNAIRHAPEGGAVTVTAARRGATLAITVTDNGPGIRPDLADRLFEPFVTGRADGTGLGLAIARELADAHGGQLNHSPPVAGETGATFILTLPQEPACQPS